MPKASTILPDSLSEWSSGSASSAAKTCRWGIASSACPRTACTPTDIHWLANCSLKSRAILPKPLSARSRTRSATNSSQLLVDHSEDDRGRVRRGAGAYYRRRHHREPAPSAAQRHVGRDRTRHLAGSAHL